MSRRSPERRVAAQSIRSLFARELNGVKAARLFCGVPANRGLRRWPVRRAVSYQLGRVENGYRHRKWPIPEAESTKSQIWRREVLSSEPGEKLALRGGCVLQKWALQNSDIAVTGQTSQTDKFLVCGRVSRLFLEIPET